MKKTFQFKEDVGEFFVNMLAVYFLILFTLGLGTPWAICKMERWKSKNTTLEGAPLKFVGNGGDLFGKFIIWYLLIFITFGIYSIWAAVKMQKWVVENTIVEEDALLVTE